MHATDDSSPLISANRRAYDNPVAFPPELATHIIFLETELASLRATTSWRITRPLRWLVTIIRNLRRRSATTDLPPEPLQAPRTYADWIERHDTPWPSASVETGRRKVHEPRLGLVVLGIGAQPDAASLPSCPPACQVLMLGESALGPGGPVQGWLHYASLPEERSGQAVIELALATLDAEYLCFLDAADVLEPDALEMVADVLARDPGLDLVFADEDWLDAEGNRTRPFLKPGWDHDLQRGRDLVGPFAFFRASLLRKMLVPPGPAWRYDLACSVAAASRPERIGHLARVLCHRAAQPDGEAEARPAIVQAQLARDGVAARVAPVTGMPGFQRVVYDIGGPAPLVSIIVPSRDRADLLSVCARGILHETRYDAFELLIVDNGSCEPDALALLDELAQDRRVRVLRRPGPFNWSALNNHAAEAAAGDVLLLLNNDIAVRHPDWLTELAAQVMRLDVGAVGAKLLYPDGRIQHAGLTTNFSQGLPRHLMRFAPDASGPFGLLALTREVWGVTGACVATRRSVFFQVGGLNEALAVGCNDVDYCVRLRASGYRILWTPWAELDHRELASRGDDTTQEQHARAQEEHDRLRRDWGTLMRDDPHYPPSLDSVTELLPIFTVASVTSSGSALP